MSNLVKVSTYPHLVWAGNTLVALRRSPCDLSFSLPVVRANIRDLVDVHRFWVMEHSTLAFSNLFNRYTVHAYEQVSDTIFEHWV